MGRCKYASRPHGGGGGQHHTIMAWPLSYAPVHTIDSIRDRIEVIVVAL